MAHFVGKVDVVRWSHVNWPAVGYVSFEDVEGYAEHLLRLTVDAPPPVALLAAVRWVDARIESWSGAAATTDVDAAEGDDAPSPLELAVIVRNDEVLDTAEGLFRRWNHARIVITFHGPSVRHDQLDTTALTAGDVHIARGELESVGPGLWELLLLVTPLGEMSIRFADVVVSVASVHEDAWARLNERPAHGWRGAVPDGWVEYATPAVRAAAHGDVGGLYLALDGFSGDPVGVDDLDPRWGFAPVHAAAWFDRLGTVEALSERGADLHVLDAEERSALDLARQRHSVRVSEFLVALDARR